MFLTVVILGLLGGQMLRSLAIAKISGVVMGACSSICIASLMTPHFCSGQLPGAEPVPNPAKAGLS